MNEIIVGRNIGLFRVYVDQMDYPYVAEFHNSL